jgi:hypothetical protein
VILAKLRSDEMPPKGKIFYHEDTDEGMVSDSLLLFRVQNQIDGVMVVNWLLQKIVLHEAVSPSLRLSNPELAEAQLRIARTEEKRMEF